ncbi:uncharacterized protein B0I36DRAFT_435019 [Microdochium trichocladiopsis]|uniref:Uncharacterized protein n=1 Tax=Microdochium trichocladiopsis TaxID=1682393 RepID=A0A9P8XVV5_9PEZI|nr:uncharacterized protein B0I36DRAFT_435019 [Microdochium trichocladiopsis]KAH7021123.1 hypothetical protein B0I36DRAFT_435019 [Microdochium trichocladiopsis]
MSGACPWVVLPGTLPSQPGACPGQARTGLNTLPAGCDVLAPAEHGPVMAVIGRSPVADDTIFEQVDQSRPLCVLQSHSRQIAKSSTHVHEQSSCRCTVHRPKKGPHATWLTIMAPEVAADSRGSML